MSRPSLPILVSSRDSTPSSSSESKNAVMNLHLRVHCARRVLTPSPPSSSPDEHTNDSTLGLVICTPRSGGHMSTAVVLPSAEQIHQNIMEDAREYQDQHIEELMDDLGATYSRTFMHATMISHWVTLFREPVSTMLTNFQSTPSIAIPAVRNLDPPPIFPTTLGSGTNIEEPEFKYPPEDDDWEVQSVDETPALPVPPPGEYIHPEVLAHLHTLHVDTNPTPAPPIHDLGPNREPITPTDPVPSMPSSPPQFYQLDPCDPTPTFA